MIASITLALGALVAVAAPASASYGNTTLDAACMHAAVQAFAPNLQGQTGWAITWQPTLYWFDGTNWQPYLNGPMQTQTSDSWIPTDFTFGNLPNGFFQVRDSFQWLYNGQPYGQYYTDYTINHFFNGPSSDLTYNELMASTSSYCYAGQ